MSEAVTGERNFSSQGRTVSSFKPIPAGVYKLALSMAKSEIQKGKESLLPSVSVRFLARGTGGESGKDRQLLHSFYLSLKPGKDGVVMPDRQNQIVAFAQAVGEWFDVPVVTITNGAGEDVDCLNAQVVKAFLDALDGREISAKVRVVKDLKGEDRNEIAYFMAEEADADTSAPAKSGGKARRGW